MASDTFSTYFPVAAARRGLSYAEAKAEILTLTGGEKDSAVKQIRAIAEGDDDWRRQLAATILLGWFERRDVFVQVGIAARGDLEGPAPMSGFTPAIRAKAIVGLGPDAAPRVIEMIYKTGEGPTEDERAALFDALAQFADPMSVMPMIDMLKDPATREGDREDAITVLAAVGDPRGLNEVLRTANDPDASRSLRESSISLLAFFEDPKADRTLLDILRSDFRRVEDRQAAAEGVAARRDPAMLPVIRSLLPREQDPVIRLTLVRYIGRVGEPEDADLLRKFTTDADADFAQAARDELEVLLGRKSDPR